MIFAKAARQARAQASLEALLAFAFLMSSLLILAIAARGNADAFIAQSRNAGLRIGLAHEALLLDTTAWAAGSSRMAQNISAIPAPDGEISCRQNPAIREPAFSSPSQGALGEIYVQKTDYEPV
jgi:hypothetical protein